MMMASVWGSADDGVAADADGGGLADAAGGELIDGLVGEGAGFRDDADVAFFVDAAGHDADLGLAGGDDARAVGADKAGVGLADDLPDLHHVEGGDAFGDADDKGELGGGGLEDAVCGKGWGDEDHRDVGAGFFHSLFDGVEDVEAFGDGSAFSRGDTADDVGAVLGAGFCVKHAFAAGDSLDDEAGVFVDEHGHLGVLRSGFFVLSYEL